MENNSIISELEIFNNVLSSLNLPLDASNWEVYNYIKSASSSQFVYENNATDLKILHVALKCLKRPDSEINLSWVGLGVKTAFSCAIICETYACTMTFASMHEQDAKYIIERFDNRFYQRASKEPVSFEQQLFLNLMHSIYINTCQQTQGVNLCQN